MTDTNKKNEYIKVAYYYYKTGLTQDEIAKKMSMSRQRVNRILKKCLETGIVKIIIQEYEQQHVELEANLESLLGLNEVIAVNAADDDEEEHFDSIGSVTASYLDRVIKDNDIIGFSRGRTLSAVINYLMPIDKNNLTVTQLVGGLNAEEALLNSDAIVRRASEILNAKPCFMYTPIILENKQLRDSLMNEKFFVQAYNTMRSCTVALVGIGDMSSTSGLAQRLFISESEYNFLLGKNAVGEICTHYFDINGKIINSNIDDRVFAIDCDSLKQIPLRIAVAGGPEKISAITGAIRGNWINVLITDLRTAQVLEQNCKK